MINSRTKRAAGEREFASQIHDELGITLKRNLEQSRSGGHDLIAAGSCPTAQHLNQFAIEVKRYQSATDSDLLYKIDEQRRIEKEDAEHQRFRKSLGIELD